MPLSALLWGHQGKTNISSPTSQEFASGQGNKIYKALTELHRGMGGEDTVI